MSRGQRGPNKWISAFFGLSMIFLWNPLNSESLAPHVWVQQEQALSIGEYIIGPQDLLEIKVFDMPELSQTVRVTEDGSITLPLLEKINVSGLTVYALEMKLASLLEERWVNTAHVSVFIREYQKVAITGAVKTPGQYELIGKTSLLQIISQAGGLTDQAMDELFIYREEANGERNKVTVDIGELMSNGNQDLNLTLRPKDVIIVPIDEIINIYVYGEVKKPGVMQFRLSRRPTLLQAIAQAGGTTEWASRSGVMITRKEKGTGKEIKIPVNLKDMLKGKVSDIELQEGDVVIVP